MSLRTISARRIFLSGFLLAVSLYPLRTAFPADPLVPNPHTYFQQSPQCPRCHIYDGPKLVPDRFATESIDFCLECHLVEERGMTHPLKVHPGGKFSGMKVPPDYRLGEGEHIVCLTCHAAHGPFLSAVRAFAGQAPEPQGGENGASWYRTNFLRRTNPEGEGFEALCVGCHKVP